MDYNNDVRVTTDEKKQKCGEFEEISESTERGCFICRLNIPSNENYLIFWGYSFGLRMHKDCKDKHNLRELLEMSWSP